MGYYSFSLPLILFIVFSVYTSTGGELTPKGVFSVLSFLTGLRFTVQMVVMCTLTISETHVALMRIQVHREWLCALLVEIKRIVLKWHCHYKLIIKNSIIKTGCLSINYIDIHYDTLMIYYYNNIILLCSLSTLCTRNQTT